jgi:hypothetical protein
MVTGGDRAAMAGGHRVLFSHAIRQHRGDKRPGGATLVCTQCLGEGDGEAFV